MRADHIFRIASQTKAITSTAVLMLYEEGGFLLDDPISRYIPAFGKPVIIDQFNAADTTFTTKPAKSEVTIRQLLTHTSGISYPQIGSPTATAIYAKAGLIAGLGAEPWRSLEKDVNIIAKLPLMHQPGEQWTYGFNTDILGRLVEVISGVSLDQFLRTRLFEPLGMKDTYFYLHKIRATKSTYEIELIQQACDITEKGFRRLLKFVKAGVWEYEIEAELIHEFLRNRSQGFAYGTIIASGHNACVLHYVENNKQCKAGVVLLLDTAAEYSNYASDLTRCIPGSGKFSQRQKAVYNAVLRVMKAATKMLKDGNTFEKYNKAVGELMTEELLKQA